MDIVDVLRYFADFNIPTSLKPRELKVEEMPGKAVVITGPRRAGKTYYLYWLMTQRGGIYVDFEHPLFEGFEPRDVEVLVEAHARLGGPKAAYLDEVQAVEGWEKAVRYLLDRGYSVYATGSTSALLAGDVAREMRGRGLTYLLLPLSFREYLHFKGIDPRPDLVWRPERHAVAKLQEEYLKFGGFPEVALGGDPYRLLKEYLLTVVVRDVADRHGVRNRAALDAVVAYVLNNYGRYLTYSSLHRLLKQRGVTKRTVINYVKYLEEAFFLFQVKRFAKSTREAEAAPRKIYLVDTGYGLLGRKDPSRDLENAVFLELLRRALSSSPPAEIYYAAGEKWEVDFLVTVGGQPAEAVQVAAELHEENMEREVEALARAARRLGARKATVVTLHQEAKLGMVEVKPFWRWALEGWNPYS
ncbi:ATP-binding protein [Pyrobaculum sp. 3827-6]|uniref:ATP-binding protein n=1 Tax=Pyrobaculum sp. 3827-6 TaxID=2983604 RepID=UPI0021D9AD0A|nr:ATP-binding protein [Pyrobaculum sp. 3827-6]MCU7788574.1 ATP-binding protein [Pyrobaculum sp. 3827-6]